MLLTGALYLFDPGDTLTEPKPRIKRSVIVKQMGAETVLFDPESGAVHTLNPTARLIWQLCDGQHSLEDMAKALMQDFRVGDGVEVSHDVKETVERFRQEGLLEADSPAGG